MLTRVTLERELRELGLMPVDGQEIGGYWTSLEPDLVRIHLIDPTGVLKSRTKLRQQIVTGLQQKFNALDRKWLEDNRLLFDVVYRQGEPGKQEKAAFGPLDFPVYLLAEQHGVATIRSFMKQHGIPDSLNGQDIYQAADDGWSARDVRAVGIPSGRGYRKVGFIKTHKVFADATADAWLAFVNVIGHELGHMGNRLKHSPAGLMKYPVPLNTPIDFAPLDRAGFLGNVLRLRTLR